MAKGRKNATKLPMENTRPADLNDSSLTSKMVDEIAKYYRLGLRDSAVANMVGKSPQTIREWLYRGASGNSSNLLYNELFAKCALAVGTLQTELIAEIRAHAMGRPTEYAKEVTTLPDGSKVEKIQLNKDGEPIVLREEIKGNPQWVAWLMERRFRNEWSANRDNIPVESTPDKAHADLLHHKEADKQDFGVEMSNKERLEMLDLMKTQITTEGLVPKDD